MVLEGGGVIVIGKRMAGLLEFVLVFEIPLGGIFVLLPYFLQACSTRGGLYNCSYIYGSWAWLLRSHDSFMNITAMEAMSSFVFVEGLAVVMNVDPNLL